MTRMGRNNKKMVPVSRSRKILPAVFLTVSFLLMILPLEGAISSAKMLLSYIFIPQIRAAHETVEYAASVWNNINELLKTHQENIRLKEQIGKIQLENAQVREILQENQRLSQLLQLKAPTAWKGIWAKTTYREPSQWNSIVIDKGSEEGIEVRAAALTYKEGQPVLAGVVLEVNEHTAKVLLLRDEDFSAAVYVAPSGDEGLINGAGPADLKINYLPLLSEIRTGDAVYTAPFSTIFPAGILVGHISEVERKENLSASLTARVVPEAEGLSVRELFILVRQAEK